MMRKNGVVAPALLISCLTLSGIACRKKAPVPVDVVSTQDAAESGLVQSLMATFQHQSGVTFQFRVVSKTEALRLAQSRAVQVVFARDPAGEFAGAARLTGRFALQDFAILGPRGDPARVRSSKTAADALRAVATHQSRFCSAIDVPDIERREKQLWSATGVNPSKLRRYSECHGDAMEALREADRRNAYTLSEATVARSVTGVDIKTLLKGSPGLHGEYGVVLVDHAPRGRRDQDAEWFVQWLMSYQGRDAVQSFPVSRNPL